MKRVIKYNYMADNIAFINNMLLELKNTKNRLINNINLIEEYYQGEDGKKIMNTYLNKVTLIDKYIHNIDRYLSYFKWLIGEYRYNQQITNNKMLAEFKSDISNITNFGE